MQAIKTEAQIEEEILLKKGEVKSMILPCVLKKFGICSAPGSTPLCVKTRALALTALAC